MRSLKETYTAQEVLELLSAISTAAFGWAGQGLAPEHEWYSVAFQDVLELRKKYDALLAQTRWIPVSERLPEVDMPVMVLYSTESKFNPGGVSFTYDVLRLARNRIWRSPYAGDDDPWFFDLDGITHWMPLPPLPKEIK